MVDTTTLIVISTIVQTIVISVTLIVFILQFRSQERAIKEASYQGLMGRYNELITTLADKPETALSLFSATGIAGEDMTKEDAMALSHLLLAYGIIEEAFLLYQKKWISEDDWLQWSAFLERLALHPKFRIMHKMTAGTFDKRFEDHVASKISSRGEAKGERDL